MLVRLSIQNYAIIDTLDISFSPQLNIITGETGAGKSIIVGALGLVLGDRADTSVSYNKERKCVVEAFFHPADPKKTKAFLQANELDEGDDLVLRREISPAGKTRAFINDTPVNLTQLRELSQLLVDLHQQFDTLELGESGFQREVLDALAGQWEAVNAYQKVYNQWQLVRHELTGLKEKQSAFQKEYDYNQFQHQELADARFQENELEEAEAELNMLTHAEGIRQTLDGVNQVLQEGESPVVQQLRTLQHQLQGYADMLPGLPALLTRLQSAYVEVQDIADELERIGNKVQVDPRRMEELNERMSLGYRLLKKHGVKTTADLIQIRQELEGKLGAVLQLGDQIKQKENEVMESEAKAQQLAKSLSAARKKQIKPLEEKVNQMLAQVGMPNARLKVEMKTGSLQASGSDEVDFLFDANKSQQFLPVGKVASGGELSRLMLCIKSQVARSMNLPTLIFDEIDTGISGEAARQVGIIMKDLAIARQVISITHQPQIAGKAHRHFFVYKEIKGDAVRTSIKELSMDERITAIAKMLSGEKPTAAAMENAREMVGN